MNTTDNASNLLRSKVTSPAYLLSATALVIFCLFLAFLPDFHTNPLADDGTIIISLGKSIYNIHRILQVCLLFGLVALSITLIRAGRDWLGCWAGIPSSARMLLLLVVVLGVISSFQAAYPLFALLEVGLFMLLGFTAIVFAHMRQRLGDIFDWVISGMLVLMGWIYLADFLTYYIITINQDLIFEWHAFISSRFDNIRFFSQLQSWTLALMVLPLMLIRRRFLPLTLFCLIPAMGWWLLLFVSATRGTALGCIVAVTVTLIVYRRQARQWLRWQAVAVGGGLVSYLFLFQLLPYFFEFWTMRSLTLADRAFTGDPARLDLIKAALEMVKSQPWLGSGPMHFAAINHPFGAHPHNALMQIAAEWGLPVAIIVVGLIVWGALTWVKQGRRLFKEQPDSSLTHLHPALFAALITAAVHALVSGVIVMPVSQLMMVLVIGWMIGIATSEKQPSHLHIGWPKRVCFYLVFVISSLGVLLPLAQQAPELEESQRYYINSLESNDRRSYTPRFWRQGQLAPYYDFSESKKEVSQ